MVIFDKRRNLFGTSFESASWKNISRPGKPMLFCWLLFMLFFPLTQSKALVSKSRKLKNAEFKEFLWERLIRDIQSLTRKLSTSSDGNSLLHEPKKRISEDGKKFEEKYEAYYVPELLMLKTIFFNKRKKRELGMQGEMSASVMSIRMPAYYPFIMAEMIPGSVETRHPSIIAVKGCPAYYIADHKGRCKQVFQYTVNFQQPSPQDQQRSFFQNPQIQRSFNPYYKSPTLVSPRTRSRQIPSYPRKDGLRNNTRLLTLLRLASKKFDAAFQKKETSSSAESKNEDVPRTLVEKLFKNSQITEHAGFESDSMKPVDISGGGNFNPQNNGNDSDD